MDTFHTNNSVTKMLPPKVLCTCSSCCPSRWNQFGVLIQQAGNYIAQKEIISGCRLRNPMPLSAPGLNLFYGHQAKQLTNLRIFSVPIKDMLKGFTSAHKDARYVADGQHKLYLVYSYLVDMSVNSFRRQYIASPDGKTKYCYFERVLLSLPKNHNYVCKAADTNAVLFTVERCDAKHLTVTIVGGRQSFSDHTRSTTSITLPTLILKFKGGTLRLLESRSGQVRNCGRIEPQAISVMPHMDQIVAVVLAAIVRDIANVGTLLKAAELAAPKPMAGAGGVAMRGAKFVLTSESGTHQAPANREEMAMQMAGDFLRSRKVTRDGDSGYGSGSSTRGESVSTQRSRSAGRVESRDPRQQTLHATSSAIDLGIDLYNKRNANREPLLARPQTEAGPRKSSGRHDDALNMAHTAITYGAQMHRAYTTHQEKAAVQRCDDNSQPPPSSKRPDVLRTAGTVLKYSNEAYNMYTMHQEKASTSHPAQLSSRNEKTDRAEMVKAVGNVLKTGANMYMQRR